VYIVRRDLPGFAQARSSSSKQLVCGEKVILSPVKTALIVFPLVFPPPRLDDFARPPSDSRTSAHPNTPRVSAVERFHVLVAGRLCWQGGVDLIRSQIHDLTGKLGPVVTEQQLRNSSPFPDLIQSAHAMLALQPLADFDG
jgi:hypothetical protein